MTSRLPFVLALAGILATTLLAPAAMAQREGSQQSWTTRGVVREIRPERRSITIHHEAIPGYMREMTMPFGVPDRAMLEGIEVGDRVELTFVRERDGHHTIRRIRVIQSE